VRTHLVPPCLRRAYEYGRGERCLSDYNPRLSCAATTAGLIVVADVDEISAQPNASRRGRANCRRLAVQDDNASGSPQTRAMGLICRKNPFAPGKIDRFASGVIEMDWATAAMLQAARNVKQTTTGLGDKAVAHLVAVRLDGQS
jgi:hypothetical protein